MDFLTVQGYEIPGPLGAYLFTDLEWERTDGDKPTNDGNVSVRFVKASLPPKAGMWQGWGFIYRFVYKDVDGEQKDEEWAVHLNKDGKLEIDVVG